MDIAEAADQNLVTHFTWPQERTPGMRVETGPAFTLVDSGLPCDTFNAVLRTRLGADEAPDRIQETIDRFARAHRPFSWWTGPADTPSDLAALLGGAGLEHSQTDPAMTADLRQLPVVGELPSGLAIRRVTTTDELVDFARLNAANWSPPDRFVVRYYVLTGPALLKDDAPIWLYVGYLGDTAIATAEITIGGGVAGLYNVSTDAGHRRRGLGSALTHYALSRAGDAGIDHAILQAEPDGIGLYRRLGFEVYGEVSEYKPAGA